MIIIAWPHIVYACSACLQIPIMQKKKHAIDLDYVSNGELC